MAKQASDAFEEYAGAVYGWAYRVLHHHHDALDVVQDVFIRWRGACEAVTPSHPRSWLRRATVNRAIDLRRRRHGAAQIEDRVDVAWPDGSTTSETATTEADRRTLQSDIAAALEALSDMQRQVLVAKLYDGLTFARIAEELNVSEPTTKTHYLRAIQAVRNRLSPRWEDQ